MGRGRTIARRGFLIGSAALIGGVTFGAYYVSRQTPNPLLSGLREGEAALTPFVKITSEGITLIVPRADVGQGVASTQAMLIAEELDIDPASATLDPGQPHPAYFNGTVTAYGLPFSTWEKGAVALSLRDLMITVARLSGSQFTGGSSSTADLFETLRQAGATARETLKAAAAARTGVAAADLRTEDGHVILPDGDRIPYTQLAAEAAQIAPVNDVALRPASEWRRLGKPTQRLDIVAKSTGTQDYGIDVTLPGMLHATVRANPAQGGGMGSYNADAARVMQGVRSVVEVDEGLAVIADNTWFAFRAANALEVEWVASDYPESSAAMWEALNAAHASGDYNSRLRDDGDVEKATSRSETFEAQYRTPFLAHAALEPLSATVLVEQGKVTIWTATQVPHVVRDAAAEITGVDPEQVILHVLPAGGSFGRRLDHDYAVQAIQIAASVPGTPVKTTWSREEDMTNDFPRPLHMAKMRGTIANGRVLAFDFETISPSLVESWFWSVFVVPPGPDAMLVWGAYDQPYAIPNYRVTGYAAPQMVPVGSWRSPGACSNSFFHEGFLSELIHAAGADPLEERLRLIDNADSRRVLEAVGAMANSAGANIGPGRGRGIAFAHTHGVPVAEVVDVTMTDSGLRIDNVWTAADCGTVFDPINTEAQLTGAAIFGLAHAMNCEITYANHAVQQTNFDAYPGMRINQKPRFHTQLLGKAERVRGLGEPATAPAAPSLADAIFAATGQRLREMPFSKAVTFA